MLKSPIALISQSVGGVGGNLNYIKNPIQSSSITNWVKGSGILLSTPSWSTSQNLYKGGALLVTWGVGTKTSNDYFEGNLNEIMTSMIGKAWKVSFTTFLDSGNTFVAGDLIVEYFDGTNTVPIGTIPIITGQSFLTELSLYPSNVIGLNSTIRIRPLIGSTTCVGNLRIADVAIAPSPVISVPAVSTEISYTASFTSQGLGVLTGIDAKYSRVGNKCKGQVKLTSGTNTGSEVRISLPPGLTTDAAIPTIQVVGFVDNSETGAVTLYSLAEPGVNYLTIGKQSSVQAGLNKAIGTNFNNTSTFSIVFEVTIAQWNNSINLVGVNEPLYLSNTETGVSTNGVIAKSYYGIEGSPIRAIGSGAALVTDDITIPRSVLPNETSKLQLRSKVDGNWIDAIDCSVPSLLISSLSGQQAQTASGSNTTRSGASLAKINAGQVRILWNVIAQLASASDGGAIVSRYWSGVTAAADGYDRWRVRIGAASMSELPAKVQASYYQAGSFTFTTLNVTKLVPATVEYDTYSLFNTTNSGAFTCPTSGFLRIIISSSLSSSAGTFRVFKNNVVFKRILTMASPGSIQLTGSFKIPVLKGDFFDIRMDTSGVVVTDVTLQFEMD